MAGTALIPLSRGLVAVVDEEDYPALSRHRWCAKDRRDGKFYAVRGRPMPGRGLIKMHREILGVGPGELVDHANGDPLDNRRANLRRATYAENSRNSRSQRGTSSTLKGVSWDRSRQKWRAQLRAPDCATGFLGLCQRSPPHRDRGRSLRQAVAAGGRQPLEQDDLVLRGTPAEGRALPALHADPAGREPLVLRPRRAGRRGVDDVVTGVVRTSGPLTGPGSFIVPSASEPGRSWTVEWQNSRTHWCGCPRFELAKRCRHVAAVFDQIAVEWAERRALEAQARQGVAP